EELSLASWNRMLAVHLTGTFLVCRAALPRLRAAGGGAIVNVASVAALLARPSLGAYAAAKGGIISFSRQLALDAAADNVRVNVIAPGSVRTPMTAPVYDESGADDGRPAAPNAIQPRLGDPEEIAAPICFLLSDEASFFTAASAAAASLDAAARRAVDRLHRLHRLLVSCVLGLVDARRGLRLEPGEPRVGDDEPADGLARAAVAVRHGHLEVAAEAKRVESP